MRNVVFVAPFPIATTVRFARAVAATPGNRVIGVFQELPKEDLGFAAVVQCPDVMSEAALAATLDGIVARTGPLARLLGVLENLQENLAWQRARLGIPGLHPEAALLFRDKEAMKQRLRQAGVPVAASRRCSTAAEVIAFTEQHGFPVVLKPPAGAGAAATVRVTDRAHLTRVLPSLPAPILAETFLTGVEHSMETWMLQGHPVFHSVTRYYPSPLEVADNPHLQWVVHLPRDLQPYHDAVRVIDQAVSALGLDTGLAHAEWFRRPDGSIAIGEIAARPPGARFMDLHAHAHGADLYRAWARLVADNVWEGPFPRRWSVAGIYLRGPGAGRVVSVEGVEEAAKQVGVHVVEAQLPRPGAPRARGYEGDGFVIVRHDRDDVVLNAAKVLIHTIRVRYG